MQNFSDFIMKCATFEEHSSSCVVYSRFSGTLFPVSMIDGEHGNIIYKLKCSKNSGYIKPLITLKGKKMPQQFMLRKNAKFIFY